MEELLKELQAQRKMFEDFKAANEEMIKAKADGKSVVDLHEKLAKINDAMTKQADLIDRLEESHAKTNSPGFTDKTEEKNMAAFKNFLKNGDHNAYMNTIRNSVRTDQDGDGGVAVPTELDKVVEQLARSSGAMMDLCEVVTGGPGMQKLVDVKGVGVVNSAELQVIENTATGKLVKVTPVWGKLEAKPLLSQEAVEDIYFNVESWVREGVGEEIEDSIENELITGNGSDNQTKGFLAYETSDEEDSVRAFGKFQFVKSGGAGSFVATSAASGANPIDVFYDVESKLKESYQRNSTWLMKGSTKNLIRKFKDAQANYLWQPRVSLAEPETFLGYPIRTSPHMPAVADGALAIAFGDFKRALRVVLRPNLYIVRDPYSRKPNVEYCITKRYGLMLKNSEAIKLIKTAS